MAACSVDRRTASGAAPSCPSSSVISAIVCVSSSRLRWSASPFVDSQRTKSATLFDRASASRFELVDEVVS